MAGVICSETHPTMVYPDGEEEPICCAIVENIRVRGNSLVEFGSINDLVCGLGTENEITAVNRTDEGDIVVNSHSIRKVFGERPLIFWGNFPRMRR